MIDGLNTVPEQTPNDGKSLALILGLAGAFLAPKGKKIQTGIISAMASPLLLREWQAQLQRERTARWLAGLRAGLESFILKPVSPGAQVAGALLSPSPELIEQGTWINLIHHPSVVLILGKRGGGKSALGYKLLEHLRRATNAYVVGLPKEARPLLPEWIGMAPSLADVPFNSVVLVDEAYIPYNARSSMTAEAKSMSQLVNLSRQRGQTLIFVSQAAGSVDRSIVSAANVVIFKDLGMLQIKFDRREFTEWAVQARAKFAIVRGDKRQWSFVCTDAGSEDMVSNTLPSFWRDKLSHVFAAGGEPIARPPKKTPLSQRMERARELSRQGLSQGEIAKLLGVSRPTIKNYLEGFPYKRKK